MLQPRIQPGAAPRDQLQIGEWRGEYDPELSDPGSHVAAYRFSCGVVEVIVTRKPFFVSGEGTYEENRLDRLNRLGIHPLQIEVPLWNFETEVDPSIIDLNSLLPEFFAHVGSGGERRGAPSLHVDTAVHSMDTRDLLGLFTADVGMFYSELAQQRRRHDQVDISIAQELYSRIDRYAQRLEEIDRENTVDLQRLSADELAPIVGQICSWLPRQAGESPESIEHRVARILGRFCPSGFFRRVMARVRE